MRGRKTGGRRKGTLNKVTVEARAVCAAILDDCGRDSFRDSWEILASLGHLTKPVSD